MQKNGTNCLKHLYFGAIILVFFWGSCGKSKSNPTGDNKKDSQQMVVSVAQKVELKCSDKGVGEFDVPINEVILSIDGKDQTIDTINVACASILPVEYKSYQIPTDAQSACGGWYAGGGDYFYAIIKDGKVKIFQGWQDEGQKDEGYHWKEMVIKL